MPNPTRRRVVTAALLVAASVSLSANTGVPTALPTARPTLVVQMTGMLMLVPENKTGKPVHVFTPPPPDSIYHYNFIVFRDDGTAQCTARGDGLCAVDMEGWFLDPIGITSGSGTARLPFGALNYSRGAGGIKVNPRRARDSANSWLTLQGGSAGYTCSLATWSFDAYGPTPVDRVPILNVLEWKIPDLPQDRVVLTRRRIDDPEHSELLATLRPDSLDRVELLVAHITEDDAQNVFTSAMMSSVRAAAGASVSSARNAPHSAFATTQGLASLRIATEDIKPHIRAYYRFLNAPAARHRFPTSPIVTDTVCPITILGLHGWGGGGPVQRGVKTYGCVVGSGDS